MALLLWHCYYGTDHCYVKQPLHVCPIVISWDVATKQPTNISLTSNEQKDTFEPTNFINPNQHLFIPNHPFDFLCFA
jgi:hypothetical protein